MWNIFIALMTITLAFAFFDPNFFVAYLISIAVFGLFQAIYMANAGGAWDNAKKLRRSRSARKRARRCTRPPSSATRSAIRSRTRPRWRFNPIIKFSTLFGLLAVEIAVEMKEAAHREADDRLHRRSRRRHAGDRLGLRLAFVLRHADSAEVERSPLGPPELISVG